MINTFLDSLNKALPAPVGLMESRLIANVIWIF